MKINSASGVGVQTNDAEAQSMEFGIGDPAMVIEILRKRLYSNPIQTLVQEYISNARDACREANMPQKIVVTIPIATNKVFKVRDYGCGISPDRIANVFVNYCSSTKRTDNKQTGGFGIGAKSAWAYTDSFTVTSYYNGVARHYIAHLGKNNSGSLDKISEVSTTEANGTEIQIAVSEYDMQAFENAVYRCTFFWDVKPELRGVSPVNIPMWYKAPTFKDIHGIKFYNTSTDNVGLFLRQCMYAVVDGIPYEMENWKFSEVYSSFLQYDNEYACAVTVNTGDVEVSASRESLSDSRDNKDSLCKLFKSIADNTEKEIKKVLDSSTTLKEFLNKYGKYSEVFELNEFKYKIYSQHEVLACDVHVHSPSQIDKFHLNTTKDGKSFRLEQIEKPKWNKMWEYEFFFSTSQLGKATVGNKLRKYCLENNVKKVALLTGNDTEFFAEMQAINIDTIKLDAKLSQKRPENELIVTIITANYRGSRQPHESVKLDLNNMVDTYVYYEKADDFTYQKDSVGDFAYTLKQNTNLKVCFIAPSNSKKVKDNPNFITELDFWDNPFKYIKQNKLEDMKIEILCENSGAKDNSTRYLYNEEFIKINNIVKDKSLIEAMNFFKKIQGYPSSNRYYIDKAYDKLKGMYPIHAAFQATIDEYKQHLNTYSKYQLLSGLTQHNTKEMAFYINAKYEALNNGDKE